VTFAPFDRLKAVYLKQGERRRLRDDYANQLAELVEAFINGDLDRPDFVDQAFELTAEFFLDAFVAGMFAGGVEGEPNSEEAGYVWWEISLAQERLRSFADDIEDGRYAGKLDQAVRRATLYGAQAEYIWWQGLASAAGDQMWQWSLGSTKEHCTDCLAYHGQRHRLSEWQAAGALPQTFSLECKGYECKCELRQAKGGPVGQLQPPGAN
jgi:hypothetical protein